MKLDPNLALQKSSYFEDLSRIGVYNPIHSWVCLAWPMTCWALGPNIFLELLSEKWSSVKEGSQISTPRRCKPTATSGARMVPLHRPIPHGPTSHTVPPRLKIVLFHSFSYGLTLLEEKLNQIVHRRKCWTPGSLDWNIYAAFGEIFQWKHMKKLRKNENHQNSFDNSINNHINVPEPESQVIWSDLDPLYPRNNVSAIKLAQNAPNISRRHIIAGYHWYLVRNLVIFMIFSVCSWLYEYIKSRIQNRN